MDRRASATRALAWQLHTFLGEHSRIASRIQKVLEDANIKLASVASNTLGKSGRAILQAVVYGEASSE